MLESVKGFALLVQEPAATKARGIVCKRDPVLESISSRRERAMEIGMDEF
jgi:hypothetical protein